MIKVPLIRNGVKKSYVAAYLDYNKLASMDQDATQHIVESNINGTAAVAYAHATYGNTANLKFYRASIPTMSAVEAPVESAYLNYCMSDVIKPSNLNPTLNRLVDFYDYETGQLLEEGQEIAMSFGPETQYPISGPPNDIVSRCVWFRKHEYGVYGRHWYELKHQLDVIPETTNTYPIQRNDFVSADFTTTNGNVIGCCIGVGPKDTGTTWVSAECKQYFGPDDSLFTYDFSYGAAVQGNRVSYGGGWMATIPEGSGVPGNGYHTAIQGDTPYLESGAKPVVKRDVSVQLVYTIIDEKEYIGLCGLKFNGDLVVAIQGNFYPVWFWNPAEISGTPDAVEGEQQEPDPIWGGPDANPQNTQGTYSITQVPAGVGGEASDILPFAGMSAQDPGLHVYVVDKAAVKKIYRDFWGSRYDVEKLATGVIRFGIIPYHFIPPTSGTGAMTSVSSITYGHFSCDMTDANAYFANGHTIMCYGDTDATKIEWKPGTGLERTWGNYLDFEPYTSVTLTVPYCGSIDIPASKCIGGSIRVIMWCNIMTGDVVAVIKCWSNSAIKDVDNILGKEFETTYFLNGNCFVDMPIAATSTGTKQTMSLVGSALGTTAAAALYAAKGQYISTALQLTSLAGTLAEAPSSIKPEVSMQGGTPGINLLANHEFILEVARPAQLADEDYKQISGTQSYLARTLENVTGYTKCLQVLRTDTSIKVGTNTQILKFPGTPTELSEIKRILQDGVIL